MTKTCITENLVEEAFYSSIERLIERLETSAPSQMDMKALAKLYITVRQYEHPGWQKRIICIIDAIRNSQIDENPWWVLANTEKWSPELIKQMITKYRENTNFLFHGCLSP